MIIICGILTIPLLCGFLLFKISKIDSRSTILLFHDMYFEKRLPHSLSEISYSFFQALIQRFSLLKNQFCTISERSSSCENRSSIVFDDGFLSNYEAAKILKMHNIKASFFVCTAHLQGEQITDVYKVKPRLSPSLIQEISEMGHEIGSHTIHHYDLRLLSLDDLRKELTGSKKMLESITGEKVTSMSVPYGLWNDDVITMAKSCGYKSIVVYNFTKNSVGYERVFPVTGVYPFDSVEDVIAKCKGESTVNSVAGQIIPHFAKGSSLGAFRSIYCKIPFPWFVNRK